MKSPKVLVISHNCFSSNTNIGRTLSSYFKSWNIEQIAQLYFHNETPNIKVCSRFYSFTDTDALKSIVLRSKKGRILTDEDIVDTRADSRNYASKTRRIYEFGRKRKPFICYLRDLMWKLSSWNNKSFKKWLDAFNPDVIFLTAGDYAFPYRIALKIAKQRKIPIITVCYDDSFINYQHKGEFFRHTFHKHLLKYAKKVIDISRVCFANNTKMAKDYERFFDKPWYVLNMAATTIVQKNDYDITKRHGIVYIGNLGYNRHLQLVEIGSFLKQTDLGVLPKYIDVYSNEKNERILSVLTEENGILFHGSVSQNEVQSIIKNAIAVLHVESFDDNNRELVKYSFSTKIADCLGSGTPLIAYGPSDVSSIEYLIENKCAFVGNSKGCLYMLFADLFNNDLVEKILNNAILTAQKNHSMAIIEKDFKDLIESSIV